MKPHIHISSDGALDFEWIYKKMRFGISFEKDITESGWYCVCPEQDISESGELPKELLDMFQAYTERK